MNNSMVPNFKINKKTYLNSNGKLLMLIMFFIVMNILSLKYSLMGFGVFVILMFILFILLGLFFLMTGILEFYLHRNFRISKYIGFLALIFLSSIVISRYVSKYQTDMSKEKAKLIVEALDKFKSINNEYPDKLSKLIPEYLGTLPSSSMGWFNEPYEYVKGNDGSYRIYFPGYGGNSLLLDSRFNGEWILND